MPMRAIVLMVMAIGMTLPSSSLGALPECSPNHESTLLDTTKIAVLLCRAKGPNAAIDTVQVIVTNVLSKPIEIRLNRSDSEFFGIFVAGEGVQNQREPRMARHDHKPPEWVYHRLEPNASVSRLAPLDAFISGEPIQGRDYLVRVDPRVQFRHLETLEPTDAAFEKNRVAAKTDKSYKRAIFRAVVLKPVGPQ